MSLEDTIGYQNEGETCAVCDKGLRRDEALAHFQHEAQRLPHLVPSLSGSWEKDPKPYIERLAKRAFLRELNRKDKS